MKWPKKIPDTDMESYVNEWQLAGGIVERYGGYDKPHHWIQFRGEGGPWSTMVVYRHEILRNVWVRRV